MTLTYFLKMTIYCNQWSLASLIFLQANPRYAGCMTLKTRNKIVTKLTINAIEKAKK